MNARPIAFVVWAAVAASAVFWVLRLSAASPSAPPHTVAVSTVQTPRGDLSRVLGAPPVAAAPGAVPEPALASRFKLLGVAAPREGGERNGLALIAVDGKPARGFKVGAAVDGEIVLQSVHPRGAALGSRGAPPQVRLDLPPLPVAATSTRPPGAMVPGLPGPAGFARPPNSVGAAPPIVTLPPQVQGMPPSSETQEPPPLPPAGVAAPR